MLKSKFHLDRRGNYALHWGNCEIVENASDWFTKPLLYQLSYIGLQKLQEHYAMPGRLGKQFIKPMRSVAVLELVGLLVSHGGEAPPVDDLG